MTLFEYENRNPPELHLQQPLRKRGGTVVGHSGRDGARDEVVAVFPRDREDHYFRKYSGYAISEKVLQQVMNRRTETIFIVERDRANRLIEFDPADFVNGTLIAYDPDEDTILEDERAIHDTVDFNDRQRVVAEDKARRSWHRDDCVIKRVA